MLLILNQVPTLERNMRYFSKVDNTINERLKYSHGASMQNWKNRDKSIRLERPGCTNARYLDSNASIRTICEKFQRIGLF